MNFVSVRQKLFLIFLGLFISLIVLEIGLRLSGFIILSLQEYKNKLSIRQKGAYRIMCLGESTTASWGDESAWPNQLERILNGRGRGIEFSVINKGIAGINTAGILARLNENLNRYKPDMVIAMMGINDDYGSNVIAKERESPLFSLRLYKLMKFIWLHIANLAKEGEDLHLERDASVSEDTNLNKSRAYFDLGVSYRNEGLDDKAAGMFVKALDSDPSSDEAHIELGHYYLESGYYDKAESQYREAFEISPRNGKAYVRIGNHYLGVRLYKRAEEMYRKALEIDLSNQEANSRLVRSYLEEGRYDMAEEAANKAINSSLDNDGMFFDLGNCYWDVHFFSKAEEMYKKSLEINPKNDRACAALAILNSVSGRSALANKYFKDSNKLRLRYYCHTVIYNYLKLRDILTKRNIQLVCVEYPVRNVSPLKEIFNNSDSIIFVDNEKVFKNALGKNNWSYNEYFTDNFGGDFGHCTAKGNKLLAENIANTIIKEYFNN